jgi:hypothetical protein
MGVAMKTRGKRPSNPKPPGILPEKIVPLIHWIRGEKVVLDRDLAELYQVETRSLKQAVRRNRQRCPRDFMFVLTKEEFAHWRSQAVISNADRMGLRHLPMAFTEQGVAMLSSVLRSPRAVEVNIAIKRTFVQLRRLMDANRLLAEKINSLEKKYDEQFQVVFAAIKELIAEEQQPRRQIGFHPG